MNAPQMQRSPEPRDGRQTMLAFQALLASNRDLHTAVTQVADDILAAEGVTPGERTLMMLVRRHRSLTVPRLAEHRGVSRQHTRVAVGALVKKELLAYQPNPAHKRSRLIVLTPAGTDLVKRIMSREGEVMARVAARLDPEATRAAASLLAEVLTEVRET